MGDKKISTGFAIFFMFLIIVFLVWGFIGEKYIQKREIACDTGIKDKLCWSWHTNKMEKFEENIRNTTSSKLKGIVDEGS